eukprot:15441064-Alexandrium_andersonii.AAC.1
MTSRRSRCPWRVRGPSWRSFWDSSSRPPAVRELSTRFAPRLPLRRRVMADPSSSGLGSPPWAPT